MQSADASHSQVIVFPPVIPLAGFLLGIALQKIFPVQISLVSPVRITGMVLLAIGVVGFVWMVRTFKRMRTPIHNARTPTLLVETGPFRFSRNPMYLFGSIGYLGLSLLSLQLWAAALLVPVVVTLHYGVVLREEEFLLSHFGDEYVRYKARVPRYF
jgi:protein-S-isoprenylcysteine O-methyltransferase Ste14